MKMLCKTLGGSRAYGLETPTSDTDYRGVFCNTDPADILGLSRFDVVQKQGGEDEVYYELRKFMELLKDGNTGALEILFTAEANFLVVEPEFKEIVENRKRLVDTAKMFKCLLGYMQSERRLANGERRGAIGGKRAAQVDQFGFSPKNFVQLFRLCFAGEVLFLTGEFPVRVADFNPVLSDWLLELKTQPEKFSKEQLNEMVDKREADFKVAFENRKVTLVFDLDYANEVLRKTYLPFLTK